MPDPGQRQAALELARQLLEEHDAPEARARYLTAIGRPEFSSISAAESLRLLKKATPNPRKPSPKRWNPPAVKDYYRDRWTIVRSLVDYGIRPTSLAECALRLIENGRDKDEAIAWARAEHQVAIQTGTAFKEPWLQAVESELRR